MESRKVIFLGQIPPALKDETKFWDFWDFWVLARILKNYTHRPRVYMHVFAPKKSALPAATAQKNSVCERYSEDLSLEKIIHEFAHKSKRDATCTLEGTWFSFGAFSNLLQTAHKSRSEGFKIAQVLYLTCERTNLRGYFSGFLVSKPPKKETPLGGGGSYDQICTATVWSSCAR